VSPTTTAAPTVMTASLAAADTGAPATTATTTEAPAAAPPASAVAPVALLPVRAVASIEPGGRVALQLGAEPSVVDAAARFEVELAGTLSDARLVLLDSQDAIVPATGSREVGQATRLVLAPSAPLTPASRYVLRVDGAATREVHDGQGRAYAPLALAVIVAGDPPPPEPKAKAKHRRTRR